MKNFFQARTQAQARSAAAKPDDDLTEFILGINFMAKMKNWIFITPHGVDEGKEWLQSED